VLPLGGGNRMRHGFRGLELREGYPHGGNLSSLCGIRGRARTVFGSSTSDTKTDLLQGAIRGQRSPDLGVFVNPAVARATNAVVIPMMPIRLPPRGLPNRRHRWTPLP
jgi:hypothetical protein